MFTVSTYHHGNLRQALLEEGLILLAEHGGEFSLRELARRVEVTANACYRHFANKDALLMALAAEGFRRLRANQAKAEEKAAKDSRLLAGGYSYLHFAHDNPALFRLMFGGIQSRGRSEELEEASRASFDTLKMAVAHVQGKQVDDSSVSRAALRAWGLVHGLSHLLLDGLLEGQGEDPLILAESALQEAVDQVGLYNYPSTGGHHE